MMIVMTGIDNRGFFLSDQRIINIKFCPKIRKLFLKVCVHKGQVFKGMRVDNKDNRKTFRRICYVLLREIRRIKQDLKKVWPDRETSEAGIKKCAESIQPFCISLEQLFSLQPVKGDIIGLPCTVRHLCGYAVGSEKLYTS